MLTALAFRLSVCTTEQGSHNPSNPTLGKIKDLLRNISQFTSIMAAAAAESPNNPLLQSDLLNSGQICVVFFVFLWDLSRTAVISNIISYIRVR